MSRATPHSPQPVPSNYARLIEIVRIAEALGQVPAEIATFVEGHAIVMATLGRKVLQPRSITAGEQRLLTTNAGHARLGGSVSFAARLADGTLAAALTLQTDVPAIAVDGLYSLARLVAEVFTEPNRDPDRASALIDALRDPVMVLDDLYRITFASQSVATLIGRTPIELVGKSALAIVHPADIEGAADAVTRLTSGREVYRMHLRALHANGTFVRVEVTGNDRTADERVQGVVLSLRSADRDLELADDLDRQRGVLAAVIDQLQEGVIATDLVGVPTVVNQAAKAMHGLARQLPASAVQLSDLRLWDSDRRSVPNAEHPIVRVGSGEHIAGQPYCVLANDGTIRHIVISGRPVVNAQGQQVASALAYHDATEARLAESDLRDRALHDPLTGLANRQQLGERLQRIAELAADSPVALCFIDLDRFKRINDTYGHGVGDEVLRTAARRLAAELRPNDLLARLGGDEFVALLTGALDRQAAGAIAERLRAALAKPVTVDGTAISLSASVGLAMMMPAALDADELLRSADLALYSAKARGRNRVEYFDDELADAAEGMHRQAQVLRDSLSQNGLVMYFQPSIDMETGEIVSLESLARCRVADGSLISPAAFLKAAVNTGMVCELDRQAFELSCEAAATLSQRYPGFRVPVSCNVAGLSLSQPTFGREILATIERHGLEASQVSIEFTESAAFALDQPATAVLHELADHGVHVVLDDFGSGYSSLVHLRDLPLSAVKVDRSLISGLDGDGSTSAIARAFVRLADSLHLTAVAEGVETPEHLARARDLGFKVAQGFHFSAAVPLEEIFGMVGRSFV